MIAKTLLHCRRFVSLSLVATVLVAWSAGWQIADADLKDDIETILIEEDLTGIAWSLVDADGIASVDSAGLRDAQSGMRFSPDTRFHVGSVTKSVLATGVLRLATIGKIDLDAPATRYLPGISFSNPWGDSSAVTVRHLLDHTSGLDDARLWHLFSERAHPDGQLKDAFPNPYRLLRVRSRPGSHFSYSNMGYTLLGMIIESVVDERYESYLDRYLLAPLGMHDSTFEFTTQEGENTDSTLAWGHVDGGRRYPASPVFLRPAAQLTTTTADLARFAMFLMGDGIVDGEIFINELLMGARGKPLSTETANNGLEAGYALGLGRRDRHGVVGYCHAGNVVGFVAMICIFPDEQKAFAYSVNMDSETSNYGRFDQLLVRELDVRAASAPKPAPPAADISDWHGRYIRNPNRFQMFEYLDTTFGAVTISAEGNSLALSSLQRPTRYLQPVGDRLYVASDRATTSHVFYRGRDGEYLLGDGFQTYEKVAPGYLFAHWLSILLGCAGLTWILIAGSVSLFRYRTGMASRPEAPAFAAALLLFVPVPLFLSQSFMALGDLTPASATLATATLLLPLGTLLTIRRASRTWKSSRPSFLNGIAAIFVLQWCVVLIASGMLPFRLWA